MKISQTPTFQRRYKKLKKNELDLANTGIREIIENPEVGVQKKGDLGSLRVHKVYKGKQGFLIAYWVSKRKELELIDLGPHENFYRDLKRNL